MVPDQIEDGEGGGRGGYNHGLAGSTHARLSLDGAYKSIVDIHWDRAAKETWCILFIAKKIITLIMIQV